MTTIGEVLADARRSRKATIKDVEKAIKIRAKYIAAMEKSAFKDIGADAYAMGFLRSYAAWLGLDPKPLVARYRKEIQDPIQATQAPGRGALKIAPLVVGVAIAATVIFLIVKLISERV
jgi:cytoskeleton protein RodZ